MVPVVFINCSRFPFIDWILSGLKIYETRTRDMLCSLCGQRVYIAETGHGKPVVRCSAVISQARPVTDRATWESVIRKKAMITSGSCYDWQPETKVKYPYMLRDVRAVDPFTPPDDVRHGRVWMEYHGEVI